MGRVGLRTVLQLHWCMLFFAALATADIPAAFAQTHPPNIVPPAPTSALNSPADSAAPKISVTEETPPDSDSSSGRTPAEEGSPPTSGVLSDHTPTGELAPRTSVPPSHHAIDKPPAASSDMPVDFTPADGLPLAGTRGVTHPVCRRCPPAQYSYSELVHRVQGNVTLDAIVGADGWVTNVRILGSLGAGLDEQAMKAVRTWQWEPARDAQGKTVAAHQTVVIAFHIPK